MRIAWRAAVVVAVFVGVAWLVTEAMIRYGAGRGVPMSQVQLAAAMAGMSAGGLAALIVGIALAWKR